MKNRRRMTNKKSSAVEQNNIIELKSYRPQRKNIDIIPRNISQEEYLLSLENDNFPIVVASGPAGTGKSYMATQYAIKSFIDGVYDKIIITRPNVAVDDNSIGHLPGGILEKMSPWMMAILDVFAEYYTQKEIVALIEEKAIEMVPLAFIRGRTFKNAIIILDEAQGTTENSMKAVLTRIGDNSKIVVTGDINQSDRDKKNGLSDFVYKIKNNSPKGIALVEFRNKDIERHPIIGTVLEMYGE